MHDSRYDERSVLWKFPLGAAFTGGMILLGVAEKRGEWLLPGVIAWGVFVIAAFVAGRMLTGGYQKLYRSGTFTEARIVEREERNDGEDQWLELVLGVDLDRMTGEYREAPGRRDARFRISLSSRWLAGGGKRFGPGAAFPILVSTKRRTALVFIDDEAIDAAAVRGERS